MCQGKVVLASSATEESHKGYRAKSKFRSGLQVRGRSTDVQATNAERSVMVRSHGHEGVSVTFMSQDE